METGAVEQIVDPDDPRLADYRHLNDAAARSAAGRDGDGGCTIVEGLVALRLVVEHRVPLRSVLLTPSRAATLGPLLEDLGDDVPVWVAERDVLAGIVGFDLHRGVLAAAVRPAPVPAPELLSRHRANIITSDRS